MTPRHIEATDGTRIPLLCVAFVLCGDMVRMRDGSTRLLKRKTGYVEPEQHLLLH